MFIELHILQNFAPSNLNRDDTGSPKECEFGGYRRARISSQCLKRAIRTAFRERQLLPEANLAKRTKRLVEELVERLAEHGKPAEEARPVVQAILNGAGLVVNDDGKTQYLLFLGDAEIGALARLCLQYWDVLWDAASGKPPVSQGKASGGAKAAKKAGKEAIPAEVRKAVETVLDGGKAADLALFGRMLADLPERNIDAASQIAHAVSTNRVSVEFDYYTAMDELKPNDTPGADMIGTVEFNSACFYRYANVDLNQLRENLGRDDELAFQSAEAFVRASKWAVPTGKQNSMAAQNPPSLVFAVLRRHGLWSLANAFVRPVAPDAKADLVEGSVSALDAYWGRLTRMYGEDGIVGKWCATLHADELTNLGGCCVDKFDSLVENVCSALPFAASEAGARV